MIIYEEKQTGKLDDKSGNLLFKSPLVGTKSTSNFIIFPDEIGKQGLCYVLRF